MATQTVEFRAASGATLTAKLFSVGSDTVVQTASAVTEATNRKGTYAATFTDPGAAEFELVAFSGAIPVCRWFVTLTLSTATFQAYEVRTQAVVSSVTVGTNNDKTGYSLTQGFPANFAALGINASGHVSRVTLVDTTTTNSDMRGTDGALLASLYTAPPSAATNATAVRSELSTELARIDATIGSRSTLTAGGVRTELATELGRIDATISSRLATSGYTAPDNATIGTISTNLATVNNNVLSRLAASAYVAPDNTSITAIKTVTDKLNTTLVVDGLVWKYTVNALSNAPGGGGGGSATIENQELILANLNDITGAVAAAVARLQLETQITGFPATICRGSDYDTTLESEIRLQLLDLNNDPITEIGGTPVDEITWLFGLGTDRQPRLVEGACSWDDTTGELVIELAATDTNATPLGSVTWQIGAQIGELIRWLGGGTTRIIERQFTT